MKSEKLMENLNLTPAAEIAARTRHIQDALLKEDMEGMLIIQRMDLFYFSGTAQNAFLYIPAEGVPLLMVKKYMPRAIEESPIEAIVEIRSVTEIPQRMKAYYGKLPQTLGFELDVMPVREFHFYKELFEGQTCLDASPLILRVRMIKSQWEIAQMEEAASRSAKTFDFTRSHLRPGPSEMEFAGMLETFARSIGHGGKLRVRDYQTEGYPWHILSGKSGGMVGLLDSPASGMGTSPAFPCGASAKTLRPNEPIMIDFDFVWNGYHMDETRMFAIGTMPRKAMDASLAAIDIHNEVLARIKPGVTTGELFEASVEFAQKLGYGEPYLGPPNYKVSFIGHGVGLELIEPPFIAQGKNEVLRPGMVFALEPKMVFEDEFTAGIESVLAVTETGCRLISQVPVQVFVVQPPQCKNPGPERPGSGMI
jgi:Xaa-Pro dipeptidase